MAAEYLHGAEVIEINRGPVTITTARTAVIGIVGIAPAYSLGAMILVTSPEDVAQFGKEVPGFTIPQALTDITNQGYTTMLVINVFNADMAVAVADEVHELADAGGGDLNFKLTDAHIKCVSALIFKDMSDVVIALVEGEDYDVDDFGNVTVYGDNTAGLNLGDSVKVSYSKLDPTTVTDAAIIGTYDEGSDTFSGIQLWDTAQQSYNFSPKLLIAPGHETNAVQAALVTKAVKYRAMVIQDLDSTDYTVPEAIIERGPLNTSTLFNTSSARVIPVFPYLVRTGLTDVPADVNRPYAPFLAGLICATDLTDGYWFSSSNRQLNGVKRPARSISAAINDPLCQANQLNAVGIVTLFNAFGTGIRSWGNRSAAYPSSTKPENFYCVRRTADVIEDSIEMAMIQFLDKPLNARTLDEIRESVNEFIRTQIQREALVDGFCYLDPLKNPPSEIALGHVTFGISIMPPTPAERITFETFIDRSLLKAVLPAA